MLFDVLFEDYFVSTCICIYTFHIMELLLHHRNDIINNIGSFIITRYSSNPIDMSKKYSTGGKSM